MGLACGAKLALDLAGEDIIGSYPATILGLAESSALTDELLERLGADLDIAARISNQHDEIGGILFWGAPVYSR